MNRKDLSVGIGTLSEEFLWRVNDIFLSGQLLIDSEENSVRSETRALYGASCTGGRICVPMTDCSVLYFEAIKTCFAGDRSMFCGGTQYEPYICCPKTPLEQNRVCGKSLVSGQFYKGLGAFPFVARIGFKSEFLSNEIFRREKQKCWAARMCDSSSMKFVIYFIVIPECICLFIFILYRSVSAHWIKLFIWVIRFVDWNNSFVLNFYFGIF